MKVRCLPCRTWRRLTKEDNSISVKSLFSLLSQAFSRLAFSFLGRFWGQIGGTIVLAYAGFLEGHSAPLLLSPLPWCLSDCFNDGSVFAASGPALSLPP